MIQMTKQQVIRPRMTHQQSTIDFYHANPCVFNTSDAGTGKTRCFLDYFAEYLDEHPGSKALVLGPLSILEAAWAGDLREWQPKLTFAIAYNNNREKAFKADVDVVLTNRANVIQALQSFRGRLDQVERCLADGDRDALRELLREGAAQRERLVPTPH